MASTVLDSIESLFLEGPKTPLPTVREEENEDIVEVHPLPPPATPTHVNNIEDMNRYIDDEMERRKTSVGMTWRKLEKCFKWQAMQALLDGAGIDRTNDIWKKAEELLKSNELAATSVEYSKEENKILRINHPDFVHIFPSA